MSGNILFVREAKSRWVSGLAAAALAVVSVASRAEDHSTFCARLAPKVHLKPVKSGDDVANGTSKPVWRNDQASGFGTLLFGGTFTTRLSLSPIDEDNLAEHKRLRDACSLTKKGAFCHIVGPARFTIETAKAKAIEDAFPGEIADVEIRTATILCRDG